MKILVVEDVPIAQRMVRMVLERLGCEVDIASDGKEAVASAESSNYDLIFMDIGLPNGVTGFDVTESIRHMNGHVETPIVALTAHDDDKYRERADEVGMNDFCTKPLDESKAKELISKYAS